MLRILSSIGRYPIRPDRMTLWSTFRQLVEIGTILGENSKKKFFRFFRIFGYFDHGEREFDHYFDIYWSFLEIRPSKVGKMSKKKG